MQRLHHIVLRSSAQKKAHATFANVDKGMRDVYVRVCLFRLYVRLVVTNGLRAKHILTRTPTILLCLADGTGVVYLAVFWKVISNKVIKSKANIISRTLQECGHVMFHTWYYNI